MFTDNQKLVEWVVIIVKKISISFMLQVHHTQDGGESVVDELIGREEPTANVISFK